MTSCFLKETNTFWFETSDKDWEFNNRNFSHDDFLFDFVFDSLNRHSTIWYLSSWSPQVFLELFMHIMSYITLYINNIKSRVFYLFTI